MKLFKYTTREAAIKILKSGALQFSIYDALNDPFEFMLQNPPHMGGGESPHYREPLASGLLLCSFSAIVPYEDAAIIPWSHYAEGHRGVVLQFDSRIFSNALIDPSKLNKLSESHIIPGVFYKVKYRKHLIQVKNYEPYQFVKGPMLSKSAAWAYEKEYRVFGQIDSHWHYPLEKKNFTRLGKQYLARDANLVKAGRLLFPFPKAALECIYFGCQRDLNYKDSSISKIHRLLKGYPKCSYDYMKVSSDGYRLGISV